MEKNLVMERGIIIDAHTHPVGPRMGTGEVKDFPDREELILGGNIARIL